MLFSGWSATRYLIYFSMNLLAFYYTNAVL